MATKITNSISLFALALGGLSLIEIITAILGVVAIALAIVLNIIAIQAKKAERKKHQAEQKLAESKLDQIHNP